jgi:hypothetical protein
VALDQVRSVAETKEEIHVNNVVYFLVFRNMLHQTELAVNGKNAHGLDSR